MCAHEQLECKILVCTHLCYTILKVYPEIKDIEIKTWTL